MDVLAGPATLDTPMWRSYRPRLLDLFCGAGGVAVGYVNAGFDVYGIDVEPQPNYPFWFQQADAMTFDLRGFDVIHASPPCKLWAGPRTFAKDPIAYTDFLGPIRERLAQTSALTIIENVPTAPLRPDVLLCGSMFGLQARQFQLRRHRYFELNWQPVASPPLCAHRSPSLSVVGNGGGRWGGVNLRAEAMGIDWMTSAELAEAIPPTYTEWLGRQLMKRVADERGWRRWEWTGADASMRGLIQQPQREFVHQGDDEHARIDSEDDPCQQDSDPD